MHHGIKNQLLGHLKIIEHTQQLTSEKTTKKIPEECKKVTCKANYLQAIKTILIV